MKKKILFYLLLFLFCISLNFDIKAGTYWPYENEQNVYEEDLTQKCNLGGTINFSLTGNDIYYDTYKTCLFKVDTDRKVKISSTITSNDKVEGVIKTDLHLYKLDWSGDEEEYAFVDKLVKKVEGASSTAISDCMLDYGYYLIVVFVETDTYEYDYDTTYFLNLKLEDVTIYAQNFTIPSQMTIYCDKEKDITATSISPSNYDVFEVDWETSNEKIVDIFNYAGCGFETMCLVGNKAGKATVTATLPNGVKKSCVVTVKNGKPVINKKKMTLTRLDTAELWITGTSQKVKWSSSNKNIVTVNKKGKVKAKKTGKATITAKVGGKKLKCVVTVKAIPVDFHAELIGYNTRSNVFIVQVKNRSKSKIRIISNGAYSQDKDYVCYDRSLCLANNKQYIDIKPGKKKTIKFKILGNYTWPSLEDHTLFFRFEHEAKTYWAKVNVWDSYYSTNKKKWKYTDEEYRNW